MFSYWLQGRPVLHLRSTGDFSYALRNVVVLQFPKQQQITLTVLDQLALADPVANRVHVQDVLAASDGQMPLGRTADALVLNDLLSIPQAGRLLQDALGLQDAPRLETALLSVSDGAQLLDGARLLRSVSDGLALVELVYLKWAVAEVLGLVDAVSPTAVPAIRVSDVLHLRDAARVVPDLQVLLHDALVVQDTPRLLIRISELWGVADGTGSRSWTATDALSLQDRILLNAPRDLQVVDALVLSEAIRLLQGQWTKSVLAGGEVWAKR